MCELYDEIFSEFFEFELRELALDSDGFEDDEESLSDYEDPSPWLWPHPLSLIFFYNF